MSKSTATPYSTQRATHHPQHEMDRNAYNAAFYALGLRWHWDSDTYQHLLGRSAVAGERVRSYLETAQPHLLKAYDADFLVQAIERSKAQLGGTASAVPTASPRHCIWAAVQAGQVGA